MTGQGDYDLYGATVAVGDLAVSDVTRFGYAGQYTDPSGLIYLRARFYDPATAQFLSVDPLVDVTGNPYGYTDGNPLQYVDPLGLDWWDEIYIDNQNELMVVNALQSFGAGVVNSLIGVANFFLSAGPEGLQIPALENPNCDPIYEGSYVVGNITGLVSTVLTGARSLRSSGSAGGSAGAVGTIGTTSGASKFGSLTHSSAGIAPFAMQRAITAGQRGAIQAHHLIERRFARQMGGNVDEWAAIVVTRSEHQVFTNAWRQSIPYGSGTRAASRAQIEGAARRVYADYPEILRALGLG